MTLRTHVTTLHYLEPHSAWSSLSRSSSSVLSKPRLGDSTFCFWDLIYPLAVHLYCQQDKIMFHHGDKLLVVSAKVFPGRFTWAELCPECRQCYPMGWSPRHNQNGRRQADHQNPFSLSLDCRFAVTVSFVFWPPCLPARAYCCLKLWAKTCMSLGCFITGMRIVNNAFLDASVSYLSINEDSITKAT